MKICLVAPRIGKIKGAFIGGSVNNVVNLSKELARKHEIHLVTTPPSMSSNVTGIDWCINHQLNIKGEPDSLQYGFEFQIKVISKIKELCKEEKCDIINTHSGTPKLGLVAGIAGKLCHIPSIHTQYTPIISPSKINKQHHRLFSNYRFFSSPSFSKLYLFQLDYIISISENVARSVRRVINKKVKVIPPCIDLSRFKFHKENFRNKFNLNDEKVILFLGERESKGITKLIEAVKMIKNKKDIKIKVIIGAGFEKEKVRDKVKKIEDSIILLDIIEDLPSILAVSHIFVAPFLDTYDIADIPLSILEAMAAGKPIIASNIGGIGEIIRHGETGILIEPNNTDALVKSIIFLIENEDIAKSMGEKAFEKAKDFDSKKISKQYEMIYEKLLEGAQI
jgi:glycosyltransferase involved in cell wall biosynthesis